MLELRQLRHFEAVHRLAAFHLAAEEQGVTQSAITKSIQKLEERLGLPLFDRTTRSVQPTAAADHLIQAVRGLIRETRELEREAALLRGAETGAVQLGVTPIPTESLIAPALGRFLETSPRVKVDVVAAEPGPLVEQLLARQLDFVVLGGLAFEPIRFVEEIAIQGLPPEPAVIVARAGHPLVEENADWTAYLDLPWAVPRLSADDYGRIAEPFRTEIERSGIPQLRLESLSACLQLAERSNVLTGAPLSVGLRAEARGGVALLGFPFPLETRYAVLTNRQCTLSPAASALRGDIRAVAAANSAQAEPAMQRFHPQDHAG